MGSDLRNHQFSSICGENNEQNQKHRHHGTSIGHGNAQRSHRLSFLSILMPKYEKNLVKLG